MLSHFVYSVTLEQRGCELDKGSGVQEVNIFLIAVCLLALCYAAVAIQVLVVSRFELACLQSVLQPEQILNKMLTYISYQ